MAKSLQCSIQGACKPLETSVALCWLGNEAPVTAPIPRLAQLLKSQSNERWVKWMHLVTNNEYIKCHTDSRLTPGSILMFWFPSSWKSLRTKQTNSVLSSEPRLWLLNLVHFLSLLLTTLTLNVARTARMTNRFIFSSGFASPYWGYFCLRMDCKKTEERNGTKQDLKLLWPFMEFIFQHMTGQKHMWLLERHVITLSGLKCARQWFTLCYISVACLCILKLICFNVRAADRTLSLCALCTVNVILICAVSSISVYISWLLQSVCTTIHHPLQALHF